MRKGLLFFRAWLRLGGDRGWSRSYRQLSRALPLSRSTLFTWRRKRRLARASSSRRP